MTIWSMPMLIGVGLMILGFILVGIEMVTPGFSIPGIGGGICLITSIILLTDTVEQVIFLALILLLVLGIMLAVILTLLSKGKLSRNFVLTESLNKESGYTSSEDLQALLGKKGVALTDLRPSGIGMFEGAQVDVLSEGSYIQKGTAIVIKKVEGAKVIVGTEKIGEGKREIG